MSRENQRFLQNVLWNWLGICVTITAAFLLSPIIIRRLGDSDFGLWVLTTSLVDYYWLIDFGMRSATIRFVVHHHARNEPAQINQALNTSLFYSLTVVPLLLGLAWLMMPWALGRMNVHEPTVFSQLVLIVSVTWAFTAVLAVFTAALEGFQRFDLINQISSVAMLLKMGMTIGVLLAGYGVITMACVAGAGQIFLHASNAIALRRVFPELRLSPRYASLARLKEMLAYGMHSVVASLGLRFLSMGPPVVISWFLPVRFVGYYSSPLRLLDYTVEAVARVGNVSGTAAAELAARNDNERLLSLATYANRYSLLVFLPLSIFLMIYGRPLLSVWLTPSFAEQAWLILTVMTPACTLAIAGQQSSHAILFGLGKHKVHARLLVLEAILCLGGFAVCLPTLGLVPAVIWQAALMLVNRGLATPYLLVRELQTPYWPYLRAIYQPLIAVPPVALMLWLLQPVLPGRNLIELIAAGALTLLAYAPIAWFSLQKHHRQLALDRAHFYWARATG